MKPDARALRRARLLMALGGVAAVAWVFWLTRAALFPFLLGAIVAYVLAPIVERMAAVQPWYGRRPEAARGVAVLTIYGVFLLALVIAGIFFIPAAVDEITDLIDSVPELTDQAQARIDSWIERYNEEVPEDARQRINQALENVGAEAVAIVESVAKRSVGIVFSTLAALLGYLSVPFFVFYSLKDRDRALGRFYSFFPESVQPDVRECVRIANHVLGAYVRGQLFLGLLIFLVTLVGLQLMDVEFAVALAVIAGVTELIPIIGPIIGAVPAVIVVLATEPDHWWWVVLFYLAVQAAENYLFVPRIHSRTVSMHPALVLVLLAIGGALFGIWGVLLIVPIAAALRDVYAYIYRRLGDAAREREAAGS